MNETPAPDGAAREADRGEVTLLLAAWSGGDQQALERLLPLVYDELRRIAARLFRREREGHTLEPTVLAHEAFLKLVGSEGAPSLRDRVHFFAVASRAMRQILVDPARRRATAKRGGSPTLLALGQDSLAAEARTVDLLAVDRALARLTERQPEQARLVELRYFGGLTLDETAEALGVSVATVKRDWRLAKAFLVRELIAA